MEKDPYVKLANMFNENKNKEYLGAMLAEVVEPMPNLKLKLLNGAVELDHEIEGDNIFISRTLTNRIDIDVTFERFESQGNIHKIKDGIKLAFKKFFAGGGEIVHPTPNNSPSGIPNTPLPPPVTKVDLPSGNLDEISSKLATKEKGKLKAQFLVTLKKGEKVLVIPNITEDQWFIVDVLENIKEVKDEWEYYQES